MIETISYIAVAIISGTAAIAIRRWILLWFEPRKQLIEIHKSESQVEQSQIEVAKSKSDTIQQLIAQLAVLAGNISEFHKKTTELEQKHQEELRTVYRRMHKMTNDHEKEIDKLLRENETLKQEADNFRNQLRKLQVGDKMSRSKK